MHLGIVTGANALTQGWRIFVGKIIYADRDRRWSAHDVVEHIRVSKVYRRPAIHARPVRWIRLLVVRLARDVTECEISGVISFDPVETQVCAKVRYRSERVVEVSLARAIECRCISTVVNRQNVEAANVTRQQIRLYVAE